MLRPRRKLYLYFRGCIRNNDRTGWSGITRKSLWAVTKMPNILPLVLLETAKSWQHRLQKLFYQFDDTGH